MDLILVHIGNELPQYLSACIGQAKRVGYENIILVHSENIKNAPRGIDTIHYEELRGHETLFRFNNCDYFTEWKHRGDLFWKYACERLFVIEAAMEAVGILEALHVENDNLVYARPDIEYLHKKIGDNVGITEINEELLSAGVMYVGSLSSLNKMNNMLLDLMDLGEETLAARYGNTMMHEMRMLKIVHQMSDSTIRILPIVPVAESEYVYDCASWGQWVGGIHHGDGKPFASNEHFIGREILNKRYDVKWYIDKNGLKFPCVADMATKPINGKELFNLHIHSKNLESWKS